MKNPTQTQDQSKAAIIDSRYIRAPRRLVMNMQIGDVIYINETFIDLDSEGRTWVFGTLDIDSLDGRRTDLRLSRTQSGYELIIGAKFAKRFPVVSYISDQYFPVVNIIYEKDKEQNGEDHN